MVGDIPKPPSARPLSFPLLGCISPKVSEQIWYRFKNAHPLSRVLLMFPRKAVDSESHSSCDKNLPFRRRQEVSARVHSPLIHTLHPQPGLALASPLGRHLSFSDTSFQHQSSPPSSFQKTLQKN